MNVNVRVRIGIWLCHYDFGGFCMFRFVLFVLSEPVWNRFFGLLSTLVLAIPAGELVGSFCTFSALCTLLFWSLQGCGRCS
jgi:hypothetical protein